MGKSIWGRTILIAVLTAVSIVLVLPSLTDNLPGAWRERSPKIHLGLDLQGGVFLRLAVEIDKAIENTTMRYADDARAILREKGIPVLSMAKDGIDGFSLTLPPGGFAGRALEGLKGAGGTGEPQIVGEGEDRIVVQRPGVKDQQRAIELVGKTALLEFKLVDEGA